MGNMMAHAKAMRRVVKRLGEKPHSRPMVTTINPEPQQMVTSKSIKLYFNEEA
jgi:hypothetical protein